MRFQIRAHKAERVTYQIVTEKWPVRVGVILVTAKRNGRDALGGPMRTEKIYVLIRSKVSVHNRNKIGPETLGSDSIVFKKIPNGSRMVALLVENRALMPQAIRRDAEVKLILCRVQNLGDFADFGIGIIADTKYLNIVRH